ncbi:MAG TPA: alpha/beta fold hydrolase [Solirubrobacteraceae bacterium]|nr:alpha/beta fold hydrolase [Solirubrobacteraceae bacterium]
MRSRLARLERPLLIGGLVLIVAHLLDLALSGPDTTLLGVVAIAAGPLVWLWARPRVTRLTRVAAGLAFGLVAAGFGIVSHGLHIVTSGPDRTDVTGVAFILGGLLLVASAAAAAAAPRRAPRHPGTGARALHALAWLIGAVVMVSFVALPIALAVMVTHAPRWPIDESELRVAHREVRVPMADGTTLAAWYVPSRNGAGVLLVHGSGGSRARVADRAAMLARHGYGVLALDLPGNGESDGRSNGLGYNAQPAIDAAVAYLARRPGVEPGRIAGFGVSLGAEVLLEAAARDLRLRAIVADGATRPMDATRYGDEGLAERITGWVQLQATRAISGMRPSPSITGLMPRIAPRPVLLVAGGGFPAEIPANRAYRTAGGPTTTLWERPDAGHTAGLKLRPREYERRTVGFLDRALGSCGAAQARACG